MSVASINYNEGKTMQIELQQFPPDADALADLGLVHKYPLHIDVLNNENGFALYVETPAYFYAISEGGGGGIFVGDDDSAAVPVHVNEYAPGLEPTYEYNDWYEDLYLRIREVDEQGVPGAWHTTQLAPSGFIKNTNPPAVLANADFGQFDSVTWLNGLEAGKDYQVQMWFDLDDNGQLNTQGRWERGEIHYVFSDDDPREDYTELSDYYHWVEPDVYSGIHTLNTDADDFNLDIDADGTMDYFI